ncbi:MAG: tetratricopeptide repeat protein [Deltaproteobacteria bacterium]|jgi:tetratricopeptide (TPR) repeat protein|nr:tetratricopeptide repeat protein [Deltaproteobacteria bacterium]MBW2537929.1 tetratricopeptide repeat protein [Deltaproteobacteria bacterium]
MSARRIAVVDQRIELGDARSLGQAPLVELLALALARRSTGTLTLHPRRGVTHLIYLHEGIPAKVRTADVVSPLDETLLSMGLLDVDTLIDCYELACDSRKLLGRILVEAELIDEDTLRAALEHQIAAKITRLFNLPARTRVEFYDGLNLLHAYGGSELIRCDPLPLIMTGARALDVHPHLDTTMDLVKRQRLLLAAGAEPSRLGLRLEVPVVEALARGPHTVRELVSEHAATERVVERTIYALALAGWLDGVDEEPGLPAEEGAPPDRASAAPEPERAPEPAPDSTPRRGSAVLTAEGISAMAARIHEASDAEVLGVAEDTPLDDVASTYLQLTRRWHPNRLEPGLAALRPTVERIYSRFIDAYASLSHKHATDRQRLRRPSVNRPAPGPDKRPRAKRAEEMFAEAERLHRSGRNALALKVLRRVLELDPRRPEYRALFAWLQAIDLGEPPPLEPGEWNHHYVSPIRLLGRVLTDAPEHHRARYYRGVLLRKTGHLEEAANDFREVIANDPGHVDAARELRLMKMRGQA